MFLFFLEGESHVISMDAERRRDTGDAPSSYSVNGDGEPEPTASE